MLELLRKLAICTSFVTASLTSAFNGDAGFGKDFVPRNLLVLGDSYSDSCNTQRYVNNDTQKVPFPTCYVSALLLYELDSRQFSDSFGVLHLHSQFQKVDQMEAQRGPSIYDGSKAKRKRRAVHPVEVLLLQIPTAMLILRLTS